MVNRGGLWGSLPPIWPEKPETRLKKRSVNPSILAPISENNCKVDSFYGEYNVNLDEKGRIALPSKIRPRDEDGSPLQLTLAPGLDGCLTLYTPDEWERLTTKLNSLNYGGRDARLFHRLVFPKSAKVTPDKQGRFLIPDRLIEKAGLNDQVMVIGVDTIIEIWDPERYEKLMSSGETTGTFEEISERLFGRNSGSES